MGSGKDWIKKRVTDTINEMSRSLFKVQSPPPKSTSLVKFTNLERTKGVLPDGTSVNTIAVGHPGQTDLGYNIGNNTYAVKKDPLKIRSLGSESQEAYYLITLNSSSEPVLNNTYVKVLGSDDLYYVPPPEGEELLEHYVFFSPSGQSLLQLGYTVGSEYTQPHSFSVIPRFRLTKVGGVPQPVSPGVSNTVELNTFRGRFTFDQMIAQAVLDLRGELGDCDTLVDSAVSVSSFLAPETFNYIETVGANGEFNIDPFTSVWFQTRQTFENSDASRAVLIAWMFEVNLAFGLQAGRTYALWKEVFT